jgi:hypothetical protein
MNNVIEVAKIIGLGFLALAGIIGAVFMMVVTWALMAAMPVIVLVGGVLLVLKLAGVF